MGHHEGARAMLQNPPAAPGMREEDIDTPALVIDLDAFEHNLDTMAALSHHEHPIVSAYFADRRAAPASATPAAN
jgi:hypothetical protein